MESFRRTGVYKLFLYALNSFCNNSERENIFVLIGKPKDKREFLFMTDLCILLKT